MPKTTINYSKKFLFLFPHPDDETFYSGGLLQKIQKAGGFSHIIMATSGDKGTKHSSHQKIAAVRENELLAALHELSTSSVHFLRLPDGDLSKNKTALSAQLDAGIEKVRPDYLVTCDFEKRYPHKDHIICYQTVLSSSTQATKIFATTPWENYPTLESSYKKRKKTCAHYKEPYNAPKPEPAQKLICVHMNDLEREKKYTALGEFKSQNPKNLISGLKNLPLHHEYYRTINL